MTSSRGELRRPGGTPPPTRAIVRGEPVQLTTLAEEAAARHWDEHPDERERYGDVGFEWCVHDLQWVLRWATIDADHGEPVLAKQLEWLGRVLGSRGYPVERLQRAVEICAEVTRANGGAAHLAVADALEAGASSFAGRDLP